MSLLSFDSRLYSRRALEAAAGSFQGFARFEIKEREGSLEVQMTVVEGTEEELEGEFANGAVAEMQP